MGPMGSSRGGGWLGIGVMVCALALLAGCGPDGGSASGSPSPAGSAGPATATTSRLPAGASPEPVLVDTRGRPLPATVVVAVRRLDAALATDRIDDVEPLYRPAAGAAPWSTVAERLTVPAHRAHLLRALRRPPEPRPEIAYLYRDGVYGLGLTAEGDLAVVGVGRDAAARDTRGGTTTTTTAAPTTTASSTTTRSPTTTRSSTTTATPSVSLADLQGRWGGARGDVLFGSDGRGVLRFPPDGGRVVLQMSVDDGLAARVVSVGGGAPYSAGETLAASTPREGVLLLGTGDERVGLCTEGVDDSRCRS